MQRKLEGKIALITGGSRGIGAAIAKRLAADGANVAITYTKGADAAASVVKEIEGAGVRGTFVATQAALKHMKSGGRIIMIGSSVGERAMTPGLVPYSATKGAVKMFTQGLSREVGTRGITVNNVQPGPIDTDLNPAAGDWAVPQKANTALDRYGSVDEVAALVAFVAGPEASYITGANLTVDGGTNA